MQTSMKKGRTMEVFKEKENIKVEKQSIVDSKGEMPFFLWVLFLWVLLFSSISKLEGNQKNIFYWLTNCK